MKAVSNFTRVFVRGSLSKEVHFAVPDFHGGPGIVTRPTYPISILTVESSSFGYLSMMAGSSFGPWWGVWLAAVRGPWCVFAYGPWRLVGERVASWILPPCCARYYITR